MSVPRMNWKGFVSTGVLKIKAEEAAPKLGVPVKRAPTKAKSVVCVLQEFHHYLHDLSRVMPLNDMVIEAVDDAKHPFHLMALNFVDTQLYDSRALIKLFNVHAEGIKAVLQKLERAQADDKQRDALARVDSFDLRKDLTAARRRVRKLEKQVMYFEQLGVSSDSDK